jgi:hypothetical protein
MRARRFNTAEGGAIKHKRAIRFIKAATKYVGKCLTKDKKNKNQFIEFLKYKHEGTSKS